MHRYAVEHHCADTNPLTLLPGLQSASAAHDDTPPPYYPPEATASSSTLPAAPPLARPTLPNIPPSNFVCVKRENDSIDGSYVIDTSLSVPHGLLPPLERGAGERKNLELYSKTDSINVNVWLVSDPQDDALGPDADESAGGDIKSAEGPRSSTARRSTRKKAILDFRSHSDSVRVKLVSYPDFKSSSCS